MGNPFKELSEDGEYDMMYWPQKVCKELPVWKENKGKNPLKS